MQNVIRWLIVSGGAAMLARTAAGPLRRARDRRIIGGGFLLLLATWILTIGASFVPVMAAPPAGIALFVFSTALSIAAAIAAAILAVVVLLRRTGKVPAPVGDVRASVALPVLLVVAAAVSFIGERVVSIIAAVHG